MSVSPIQIKVTEQEREVFVLLAHRHRLTITDMVKKSVIAFSKTPAPADDMAKALADLKSFAATPDQLVRHRAVKKAVDLGHRQGLDKRQSLDLLTQLQKKVSAPKKVLTHA